MNRLTRPQRDVLEAMRARGIYEPDGGAVTSTETLLTDRYNLFIHWRTAQALQRRGLVKIHDDNGWSDDGYDVTLTEDPPSCPSFRTPPDQSDICAECGVEGADHR